MPEQRRKLTDRRAAMPRRSGRDRRERERRAPARASGTQRWSEPERRELQRRQPAARRVLFDRRLSRRRETPTPFTAEEAARIQRMFVTLGFHPACPACTGGFRLGAPIRRGRDVARRVACVDCRRATVVVNTLVARLLFVENNQAIRDGVRSILADAGHEVIEAPDGAAGLEAYRDLAADVVIVDMNLPAPVDGLELVRRLRNEFPEAAIVALSRRTSYGVADPLASAGQLGAVRLLRMPFASTELLQAVEEARSARPAGSGR